MAGVAHHFDNCFLMPSGGAEGSLLFVLRRDDNGSSKGNIGLCDRMHQVGLSTAMLDIAFICHRWSEVLPLGTLVHC